MTALQNAMAAVAYAEEGEFDTAREILSAGDKKKKRMILGINDLEIKPRLIHYAHELSKRVGAQLEVLQILTPSLVDRIYDCMHSPRVKTMKDKGIAYKIVTGHGTIEEDLLHYAKDNRNVQFVLLKSNDKDKVNIMKIMNKLHCPVVVFSEMM